MKKLPVLLSVILLLFCACAEEETPAPVESEPQSSVPFEQMDVDKFPKDFTAAIYGDFYSTEEKDFEAQPGRSYCGGKAEAEKVNSFFDELKAGDVQKLLFAGIRYWDSEFDTEYAIALLSKLKAIEFEPVPVSEYFYAEEVFYETRPMHEDVRWDCIVKTTFGDVLSIKYYGDFGGGGAGVYVRFNGEETSSALRCYDDLGLGDDLEALCMELFGPVERTEEITDNYEIFMGENGKYGLKNLEGEIVAEPKYAKITDYCDSFILINVDGSRLAPCTDYGKGEVFEVMQTKPAYDLFICPDGVTLPGAPYESVYLYEWGETFELYAQKDGKDYWIKYANGKFETKLAADYSKEQEEIFGYIKYHRSGAKMGLKTAEGKEIISCTNSQIDIPFADRAVATQGSLEMGPEGTRAFIYELPSGRRIEASYNKLTYYVFEEGYFAVGISEGESTDLKPFKYNGEVRERGRWFVDKNGTEVSERYDFITTNPEGDRWVLEAESLDTVVYCYIGDKIVKETTVGDLLIKG